MNSFEKQYYESETFWHGEMLTDPANKERIRVTSSMIPHDVNSIVDIGCGNGVFVNYLLQNYPELTVTGVDRSATALKYVHANKVEADIADLPFNDNSYDCVTCLEVIEHLPVPVYEISLKELARVSSKYIIVSVPFEENLENSYNRCPSCKTIFNFELHVRNYTEKKMIDLFSAYSFECMHYQKLNASQKLFGHDKFRKIFYSEQYLEWKSPICPVCGYSEESQLEKSDTSSQNKNTKRRKWVSFLTVLPKLFWPKETKYYWIIGVYKRII